MPIMQFDQYTQSICITRKQAFMEAVRAMWLRRRVFGQVINNFYQYVRSNAATSAHIAQYVCLYTRDNISPAVNVYTTEV